MRRGTTKRRKGMRKRRRGEGEKTNLDTDGGRGADKNLEDKEVKSNENESSGSSRTEAKRDESKKSKKQKRKTTKSEDAPVRKKFVDTQEKPIEESLEIRRRRAHPKTTTVDSGTSAKVT